MTERRQTAAKVVRLLTEAKANIADRLNWAKRMFGFSFRLGEIAAQAGIGAFAHADKMCLDGACMKAAAVNHLEDIYPQARAALARSITGNLSNDEANIWMFNDYSGTTHDDALSALDLAIEDQCKIVREEAAKNGEA